MVTAVLLGVLNGLGFFAVFYVLGIRHHMGALLLVAAGASLAFGLVAYVIERRRAGNPSEARP